jgi:hypothetical protein
MRGRLNDNLRMIIGCTITLLGFLLSGLQRRRITNFSINQGRLKRKYKITNETPVLSYGSIVVSSIQNAASKAGRHAMFAETSGTTGNAKQMLYTKRRLLRIKWGFSDMFMRACYAFRIKRACLYVFSSFQTDASVTSLLLGEARLPNYFVTLQAPYRVEHHPAIRALVSEYGSVAVRLWILTISNPGVLYSTNPSTISTFLDELSSQWRRSSKLIKDWHEQPASFAPEVHRIAGRLKSRGCEERLRQIAGSHSPLTLSRYAPAVEAYICWTGGYVQPFLERLARHLPSTRYRLIPMYSMSTEAIETLPYFRDEDIAFFPIDSRVVYEFIDETAPDRAESVLSPQQLVPGKIYAMVVSDVYGLRRYQTEDLFLCKRKIHGLPDLVFVRRRGLEYSFTGEKLSAEQLSAVFQQLRSLYPELRERFLTCVPSKSSIPHYKVLVIGDIPVPREVLASQCDQMLSEMNCEYKSKRVSGRLGPVRFIEVEMQQFIQGLTNRNWESQMKCLPLTRCMWEDFEPVGKGDLALASP